MANLVPAQTYLAVEDLEQVDRHAQTLGIGRAAMLRIFVHRALRSGGPLDAAGAQR